MPKKILILGACGQIGTELTLALRTRHGADAVLATDIKEGPPELMASGPFAIVDATDFRAVEKIVHDHQVVEVYLMAAMLSATAEKFPSRAWELNMNSLFHVLELARQQHFKKLFWPSSIAVFGPSTPKENTPQHTTAEPTTVYGITKLAGEGWCSYYHRKHGVDVRSLRYPGLISWKTEPGGGTTDYAVEIYHEALKKGQYECFLAEHTRLPMMYMDDAIRATLELMEAPSAQVSIRNSYNLGAMSFTPSEIAQSIREHLPGFRIGYRPDFRQEIAASWPQRIDDRKAREDWGWKPCYTLQDTTREMLARLRENA